MTSIFFDSWYTILAAFGILGSSIVLLLMLRHHKRKFIIHPVYSNIRKDVVSNGFTQHALLSKEVVSKHKRHITSMQSFVAGVLLATLLFTLIQFDKKLQANILTQSDRKKVLQEAELFIGTKYVYGAQPEIKNGKMGPGKSEWENGVGFDCSSFTMAVFHNAVGISLPRTSSAQAEFGVKVVSIKDMQAGDLLFFDNGGRGSSGTINHVGMVFANDGSGTLDGITMIHAGVYPTEEVQKTSLSGKYWDEAFVEARSLGTLTKDVKTPVTTKPKTKTVKFNDSLDTYPKTEPTPDELTGKVAASRTGNSSGITKKANASLFNNVTPDYEYYDALKWAVSKGVIKAGGDFDWGRFVTRAEVAKMFAAAAGLRETEGDTGLSDIDNANHWVRSFVRILQAKDVIDGFPDHTFKPDLPVRVEEAGKMLLNLEQLPQKDKPNYADVKQDHWFSDMEGAFKKDDLIPSNTKGEIKFGQGLERGRAIEMLYRVFEKKD